MKLLHLDIIKIFGIFGTINLLIYPSIAISDNLSNVANKLFNAYEYDDKINNYLKTYFSFESSKNNISSKTKHNFKRSNNKAKKNYLKIKSQKKMIYNFGDGQSLQINPSDINGKIIYKWTPNSYFEINDRNFSYGIKFYF